CTANSSRTRKTTTPKTVPMRPVPRSSGRLFADARAVGGVVLATDDLGLLARVLGRALEDRVEREPHPRAEEGHDQHRDGGRDDTLALLIRPRPPADGARAQVDVCPQSQLTHAVSPFRLTTTTPRRSAGPR